LHFYFDFSKGKIQGVGRGGGGVGGNRFNNIKENFMFNKGVCRIVALPFTFKTYLKAKKELRKLKYFAIQKI
jgi:hypothetical protein